MRRTASSTWTAWIILAVAAVELAQSSAQDASRNTTPARVLSRIAFGSCARQDRPQPIWYAIREQKPDLFLFIGDNIYGDTDDMDVLKLKYELLGAKPGFQMLRAHCPVLATWDDHDMGRNDAGVDYPKRRESQQIMLDFFREPADSPRRSREGVYDARLFGPPHERVQVILLDTRYFRTPLARRGDRAQAGDGRPGPYDATTDPSATVLGETQWNWLAEQLRVPARLRIIASSIQVISPDHAYEKWANFPRERQRLFQLIHDTNAGGVIFISGDRHQAELSCLAPREARDPNPVRQAPGLDPALGARGSDTGSTGGANPPSADGSAKVTSADVAGPDGDDNPCDYPLYDLTSSGLNQGRSSWENELNRHRVGCVYILPNFGLITIDWQKPDPLVSLQIRDTAGEVVIRHDFALRALGARGSGSAEGSSLR